MRRGRGRHPFGTEQILDRDGHTVERPQGAVLGAPGVRRRGTVPRDLGRQGDEGVQAFGRLGRGQRGLGQIDSGKFALIQAVGGLGDGQFVKFGHYSTTLGTV